MDKTVSNSDELDEYDSYETFLSDIQRIFNLGGNAPLFVTNAENLWDAFISHLPDDTHQQYTCHTCRHFIERFGRLVYIASDGSKESALWKSSPEFFHDSVSAMRTIVEKAKVTGIFVSDLRVYGQPITGEWHHMAVTPPDSFVWRSVVQTASQNSAEKLEDFKMLISALQEYQPTVIDQALKLLRSDSLYRSEKVLGVAEWLKELHTKRATTKNAAHRENITWLAVATAPAGFCHVKSTMIGTLLDDIATGMVFDDVSRRFAAKMHPLQYQRPQVAPTPGNIAQAEKIIQQLGTAGAFERRFARLDELKTIWKPAQNPEPPKGGSIFSHLIPKNSNPKIPEIEAPAVTMTWEKFSRTVLPGAISIEFYAQNGRDNYSAITTAARDDAPPILQWDSEQNRNPFASYVYHNGSSPKDWNITPGFVPVSAVCFTPSMWQTGFSHHGKSVYFILSGAKDTRYKKSGNAIFPENLKNDFHSIRATVEAYSRSAVLGGYEEASACGIAKSGNQNWDLLLRVTSDIGITIYKLDRWD